MGLRIHLNNGEQLYCEGPSRNKNIGTLAKQISECALVHSVDANVDGPADETERWQDGKCVGFVMDLGA